MTPPKFDTLMAILGIELVEHHRTMVHTLVEVLDLGTSHKTIIVRFGRKYSNIFMVDRLSEAEDIRRQRDALATTTIH
jgi:hypothetical protein